MVFEVVSLGFQILKHSWFITSYPSHHWSRLSTFCKDSYIQASLASGDTERKVSQQNVESNGSISSWFY